MTQEKNERLTSELTGRARCDSTLEEGDITHALNDNGPSEEKPENEGNLRYFVAI